MIFTSDLVNGKISAGPILSDSEIISSSMCDRQGYMGLMQMIGEYDLALGVHFVNERAAVRNFLNGNIVEI